MVLGGVALLGVQVGAQFDDEEEEKYYGQKLGKINSFHHQVSGDVYAVDMWTILIRNFVYDGNGRDTFFWAGSSNQPGQKGFIVPDKNGKTNVLDRYLNEEFTINLPDNKQIVEIKWFSVYDISSQDNYGDIYIPEGFEPPGYQALTDMGGKSNGVRSLPVIVMDSKSVKLPGFHYDGLGGDVYFFAGEGPQPSSKGYIIPDELGYLSPIRRYEEEDVILQLPGEITVFNIDWIAVYNIEQKKNLGHVIIPEGLNIPPALVEVISHKSGLPNCVMLHKNLMVSWEAFPPQLTMQLAGYIGKDEYMAFGVSGKQGESVMTGGDVAVAYMDQYLGHVDDYNLTAKSVCHTVLGQEGGACRDSRLGGQDSNQLMSAEQINGVTAITYRKTFSTLGDLGDIEISSEGPTSVIWAMGKLSERAHRDMEPSFHHTYSREHVALEFGVGRSEPYQDCFAFTSDRGDHVTPWRIPPIFDPTKRSFTARLGPSGGKRGYSGRKGNPPSSSLVWFVEGLMAPDLYMRRGLTYTFKVEGGSNPRSAEFYHPLIVTDEPVGGYLRLTKKQKEKVRVLAGIEFTYRGIARPMAAGRLCRWKHKEEADRRQDDELNSFERFRNSLDLKCDEGEAAILELTPNVTWPDVVYYHSYTTPHMGWKIHIVDSFSKRPSFGAANRPFATYILLLISVPLILNYYH